MLSKGRRIYKKGEMDRNYDDDEALGKNYSLLPGTKAGKEAGKTQLPTDYDVFSDIKQSYERTLAKLVTQVSRLKEEMTREKKERLRCEKLAEEVTISEKKRVKEIQMRY